MSTRRHRPRPTTTPRRAQLDERNAEDGQLFVVKGCARTAPVEDGYALEHFPMWTPPYDPDGWLAFF